MEGRGGRPPSFGISTPPESQLIAKPSRQHRFKKIHRIQSPKKQHHPQHGITYRHYSLQLFKISSSRDHLISTPPIFLHIYFLRRLRSLPQSVAFHYILSVLFSSFLFLHSFLSHLIACLLRSPPHRSVPPIFPWHQSFHTNLSPCLLQVKKPHHSLVSTSFSYSVLPSPSHSVLRSPRPILYF